jgi:hypothetical protein
MCSASQNKYNGGLGRGKKMLTYLEAFALAMAAVLNLVLAYEERNNRRKAALLYVTAAFLALVAVHTIWPFY